MIRIKYLTDVEPDEGLIGYLESQREIVNKIMVEVHDEISPLALAELRTQPGAVQYPIEWTSDKQRKAFFATDGFGKGIPTRRTGQLANSWLSYVQAIDDNGFGLVFENPSDAAKFVGGSLAQDRTQALRFKQRFHDNTGWQDYTDTVQFWLEAADELFVQKFDERIGEFGKAKTRQRAFTSG